MNMQPDITTTDACPNPELCRTQKRHVHHGRMLQIWRGEVLTPAECAAYRDFLLARAGLTMAYVPAQMTATRPDKPLPGKLTMAKNLAVDGLRHIRAGLPQADEATVSRRRELCMACPEHRSDDRCASCGCWLKDKIAWALTECPLKKW